MQFYKVTGIVENEEWERKMEDRSFQQKMTLNASRKSRLFNQKHAGESFVTLTGESIGVADLLVVLQKPLQLMPLIREYLEDQELVMRDIEFREISLKEARGMLTEADRRGYIYDDDEVFRALELDNLGSYRAEIEFEETVLDPENTAALLHEAKKAFADATLIPELKRISRGNTVPSGGHPVHDLVKADDPAVWKKICGVLLQSLHARERIRSLRYVCTEVRPGSRPFSKKTLDQLYKSSEGGTVIISYQANNDRETGSATVDRDTIEMLCRVI